MDYSLSYDIDANDSRQEQWKIQRETRGFDSTELWNLDTTIAKFIAPRLKVFREDGVHGWPSDMTPDEWEVILDKMVSTFEFLANEGKYVCFDQECWTQVDEGLGLFAKYYSALWN